jgi:anti-sigma regulatory factor (Ser/Thr protein kinase)
VRLLVQEMTDVGVARSMALRFALAHGVPERRAQEAAIVAGELASNLVRHAGAGELYLEWASGEGALVVRSLDHGSRGEIPPALLGPALETPRAVDDSGAFRRSLGTGFGAVRRLSDRVDVRRAPDGALEIVALRKAR